MNNIEQNILMPTDSNMTEFLNHIGLARNNMAVVEPDATPVPPAPPNMVLVPIEVHGEFNGMNSEANITVHSTNETTEPMMDEKVSIETQELDHPEGHNIDWIDAKLLNFIMDKIENGIAINARSHNINSPIAFSPTGYGYQLRLSEGVTPDPPPSLVFLQNNDLKIPINATEWEFPVAWATDWINKQVLESNLKENRFNNFSNNVSIVLTQ